MSEVQGIDKDSFMNKIYATIGCKKHDTLYEMGESIEPECFFIFLLVNNIIQNYIHKYNLYIYKNLFISA